MPTSKRRPRNQPPASSASKPQWGMLVVGILAGALVMRVVDNQQDLPRPGPSPSPNDVVIDNNKPNPSPKPAPNSVDLKQCYLIVVLQRKSMPADFAITMDDTDFWHSFVAEKLGEGKFRELQPGTEDAKQFEAAAQMPAPFVMLVPQRGPPVWTMPLPKGTTDPIRQKLGG